MEFWTQCVQNWFCGCKRRCHRLKLRCEMNPFPIPLQGGFPPYFETGVNLTTQKNKLRSPSSADSSSGTRPRCANDNKRAMNIPEHILLTIRSKYARPAKLSDPCLDFTQEELTDIIRKSDADLTDTDLICIFQSYLPAGEYCESIYFLPVALERVCNDDGDGAAVRRRGLAIGRRYRRRRLRAVPRR